MPTPDLAGVDIALGQMETIAMVLRTQFMQINAPRELIDAIDDLEGSAKKLCETFKSFVKGELN